ncbi:HNH endonuclease [Demequina maris]|uniref:HNH endonuclease n=1 Tax=Demequina maris TaxID=1638982 RepID=UPI0009E64F39|nr:HNH endonuclease signature motif containing protein [Demequina maris]
MLRVVNATHYREGFLTGVKWRVGKRKYEGSVRQRSRAQIRGEEPTEIWCEGATYWHFEGSLYKQTATENLSPTDVRALIDERLSRERARLARARARSEQADTPSSSSARQAIAKEVRHSVWQRDRGRCTECGSNENLEFDHIIPVSMGGANTERNIQLLCEPCNRSKGATLG